MKLEFFGSHMYVTHSVVIGALPTVMIRCGECGWVRGVPGQDFNDIWDEHIDNVKASDRSAMTALRNDLLTLRERTSRG